jgi:hypothetical protein
MPNKTKKLSQGKVQVVNADTGRVVAKNTTKAKKQISLLNSIHKK